MKNKRSLFSSVLCKVLRRQLYNYDFSEPFCLKETMVKGLGHLGNGMAFRILKRGCYHAGGTRRGNCSTGFVHIALIISRSRSWAKSRKSFDFRL